MCIAGNKMATKIKSDLAKLADREKAKFFPRFFKAGPGEYGEGDKFIGVTVPNMRLVARKYKNSNLKDLQELLNSPIHEHRLTALIILVNKYKRADEKLRKEIAEFYLKNTKHINNWDLVDLSACYILGGYYLDKDRSIIYKLVKSKHLWERRISVLTTFWFIKNNQYEDSLKIAKILLYDKHDLIHKAVGWMLREIGKKDVKVLENFLQKYYQVMPRTMLRYAIEKFPEAKRQKYLKKD